MTLRRSTWMLSIGTLAATAIVASRGSGPLALQATLFVAGMAVVGILADLIGVQLAVGIFGAIPMTLLTIELVFGWKTLKKM